MGTLYYGDNLDILRRYLKDETVDLVYLDPPFNSAAERIDGRQGN
jgi:16S rRNA G966 N2-methylase RsmD